MWHILSECLSTLQLEVSLYTSQNIKHTLWRPILMAAKSYGFLAPKTGPWKCIFFEVSSAKHVGSGPLGTCAWFGSGSASAAKGLVTCCRICKGLKLRRWVGIACKQALHCSGKGVCGCVGGWWWVGGGGWGRRLFLAALLGMAK